jgi:hypothetical protein
LEQDFTKRLTNFEVLELHDKKNGNRREKIELARSSPFQKKSFTLVCGGLKMKNFGSFTLSNLPYYSTYTNHF